MLWAIIHPPITTFVTLKYIHYMAPSKFKKIQTEGQRKSWNDVRPDNLKNISHDSAWTLEAAYFINPLMLKLHSFNQVQRQFFKILIYSTQVYIFC